MKIVLKKENAEIILSNATITDLENLTKNGWQIVNFIHY